MCNTNHDQKTLDFIKRAESVHGAGTYDYTKSVYTNNKTKLTVICPKHNCEFTPTPTHFLRGSRCPECGRESGNLKQSKSKEEFVKDAVRMHGNKYNYDKSVYINKYTKLIITCPTHGDFEQTPSTHLVPRDSKNGESCGCPKCGEETRIDKRRFTNEEFILRSIDRYGVDAFDYSKLNYINDKTDVKLICKKHDNEFNITPSNHYRGAGGCKKCQASSGEITIRNILTNKGIKFEEQKTFPDCVHQKLLKFDFYLPDHNTVIEFHGIQHFEPVAYFGGEEGFKLTQERDKIKKDYCVSHGINLIELTDPAELAIFKALSIYE